MVWDLETYAATLYTLDPASTLEELPCLLLTGTILCYGQTGAGKTFTMTGATENYKHRGLIPRSLQQLYKEIEEQSDYSINVRYASQACPY